MCGVVWCGMVWCTTGATMYLLLSTQNNQSRIPTLTITHLNRMPVSVQSSVCTTVCRICFTTSPQALGNTLFALGKLGMSIVHLFLYSCMICIEFLLLKIFLILVYYIESSYTHITISIRQSYFHKDDNHNMIDHAHYTQVPPVRHYRIG